MLFSKAVYTGLVQLAENILPWAIRSIIASLTPLDELEISKVLTGGRYNAIKFIFWGITTGERSVFSMLLILCILIPYISLGFMVTISDAMHMEYTEYSYTDPKVENIVYKGVQSTFTEFGIKEDLSDCEVANTLLTKITRSSESRSVNCEQTQTQAIITKAVNYNTTIYDEVSVNEAARQFTLNHHYGDSNHDSEVVQMSIDPIQFMLNIPAIRSNKPRALALLDMSFISSLDIMGYQHTMVANQKGGPPKYVYIEIKSSFRKIRGFVDTTELINNMNASCDMVGIIANTKFLTCYNDVEMKKEFLWIYKASGNDPVHEVRHVVIQTYASADDGTDDEQGKRTLILRTRIIVNGKMEYIGSDTNFDGLPEKKLDKVVSLMGNVWTNDNRTFFINTYTQKIHAGLKISRATISIGLLYLTYLTGVYSYLAALQSSTSHLMDTIFTSVFDDKNDCLTNYMPSWEKLLWPDRYLRAKFEYVFVNSDKINDPYAHASVAINNEIIEKLVDCNNCRRYPCGNVTSVTKVTSRGIKTLSKTRATNQDTQVSQAKNSKTQSVRLQ